MKGESTMEKKIEVPADLLEDARAVITSLLPGAAHLADIDIGLINDTMICLASYRRVRRQRDNHATLKLLDAELQHVIPALIRRHWSPEQIKGRLALDVSVPTIYSGIARGLLPGIEMRDLRRKGKAYRPAGHVETRGRIPDRTPLEDRPRIVDTRRRRGDYEGDTLLGKHHEACLVTYVDRTSRYLVADKLGGKCASEVLRVSRRILTGLPLHTLTVDNGSEFSCHKRLAASLGARVLRPRAPAVASRDQ
jgi:IS30 family transposase